MVRFHYYPQIDVPHLAIEVKVVVSKYNHTQRRALLRQDLNKLLCEHERHGSHRSYGEDRRLKPFEDLYKDRYDDDDEPFTGVGNVARESMRARFNWMYNRKEFGENLSPLYGIVRKNVGRRWDKVYSELCEVFDMRSVINQHILQHLYRFVEKDVFVGDDGKLWIRSKYGGSNFPLYGSDTEYYIDPRDDILKRNHRRKTYRQANRERAIEAERQRAKVLHKVSETIELHKINDVWFVVEFIVFKGHEYTKKVVSPRSNQPNRPHVWYYRRTEYPATYDVLQKKVVEASRVAISKRTASHKELKKYGIVD